MARHTPPRFVVRTLVVTLATVAFVLSAVLLVVTLNVRDRVRAGVVGKLETGQRLLRELENRRAGELRAQVETLAENSTLKAALDTYQSELRTTSKAGRQDLLDTIGRELKKHHPLKPGGETLEVDTLTTAFNTMMQSVKAAEAETLSAYLGTIRALALALDARDPYTAGHSERVSAVSLAIGRALSLDEEQLEVLRLGALLHDIGKIGISDQVLMKPGALTAEEYEIIKQHPGVGARILRSVPFLEPHIPIVELHHERPDGKGYPHGLRGTEIPLVASIVHVADAFDAMTSARAYRPAWTTADGLRELWRCAGSQFDAEVVQALATVLPDIDLSATGSGARVKPIAMAVTLRALRA